MAIYTKRVQTALTEEQYSELIEVARKLGKPLSLLVRDAIEQVYLERAMSARRQTALASLLNAPVADWEQVGSLAECPARSTRT